MGRAREVGWMAAGLMIGAGACYCVYKLTIGKDESDKSEEEEEEDEWGDDQELEEEQPNIWFDFTTLPRPWNEDRDWTEPGAPGGTEDRPSGGGKANRAHPIKQRPSPYEHKNTWTAQSSKNISCVLNPSKCPSLQGKSLFAEPKDAIFSLSHDVKRHFPSPSVIGSSSPTPHPTVREKALCAPDTLNASAESQAQIKMYANEVCRETVSRCCDSFLQQAGLTLLISMTVINNMLAKSVSDLKFPLIFQGSGCAKVQALEPLVGLSEKPVLAGELLGSRVLLPLVINRNGNRESLLEMLTP